jgi:hypothetical protein
VSGYLDLPRPILYDNDYWLCRCEGFHVDRSTERLGVVTEVRFRSRLDRPDELVVRGGMLGNRVQVIPVQEIAEVLPREERITLKPGSEQEHHETLARLRAYLTATLRHA